MRRFIGLAIVLSLAGCTSSTPHRATATSRSASNSTTAPAEAHPCAYLPAKIAQVLKTDMPAAGEEHAEDGYLTCGYYSAVTHDSVLLSVATPQFFHGLDTADKYVARLYAQYPPSQRTAPSGLGPDSVEYWLPKGTGKSGVAMLSWTKSGDAFTLMVSADGLDRSKFEDAARQIYAA